MKRTLLDFSGAKEIINAIHDAGGEIRFIGGCVRDFIANIPTKDIDFATDLLPEQIESALTKAQIKNIPTGKKFGTITAVYKKNFFEITTLRVDVETNGRKAVVQYTNNWQLDALRRDFTINSLSYDPIQNVIYDYFGGQNDLSYGIVKFVGNPEERVKEDYLRILRYYRFNGIFGKEIDTDSKQACIKFSYKIKELSGERKFMELKKISASDNWFTTLKAMYLDGILDNIFTKKIDSNDIYILQALDNNGYKVNINLMIYLLSQESYKDEVKNLKLSNAQLKYMKRISQCIKHKSIETLYKELCYKYGKEIYLDAFKIVCAERDDFQNYKDIRDKVENWEIPTFPVKGKDLQNFLGLTEGKKLGNALKLAEDKWIKSQFTITNSEIIDFLRDANF